MKTFLKVIVFSALILSVYTIFPMTLPQQRSEPPPLEEKVGALTMDKFIDIGKDIFDGKRGGFGGCVLCHDPKLGRAPQLANMSVVADERLKEPRYKGKAKSGEEYLRESMMEPSAFVVAGYGVAGTNDTQSPMLNISQYLKPWEVDATIAYLQSKDGGEATVLPPTGEEGGGGGGEAAASPAAIAVAKTPEEALKKFGCGACHRHEKAGLGGAIAPDLSHIGSVAGKRRPGMGPRDYISESILSQVAFLVPGQPPIMPQDFADKMMVKELGLIVQYLADSK